MALDIRQHLQLLRGGAGVIVAAQEPEATYTIGLDQGFEVVFEFFPSRLQGYKYTSEVMGVSVLTRANSATSPGSEIAPASVPNS